MLVNMLRKPIHLGLPFALLVAHLVVKNGNGRAMAVLRCLVKTMARWHAQLSVDNNLFSID
jgi:hypothetical protein